MKKLPRDIRNALHKDAATISPQFRKELLKQLLQGAPMATSTTNKRSIFSHKFLIPTGAALVLVALVGAGTYTYGSNKGEKASLRNVQLPADLSSLKSVDEIRTLAGAGLIGDLRVTGVELEQEDSGLLYKVKFSDGTYKLYDAKTGSAILASDVEIESEVPASFVAGVTIDTAQATAKSVFPDKTITKIELETEDGLVVYKVKFSDDSRVDVSAVDGSVVRTRDGASTSSSSIEDESESESESETENTSGSSQDDSNNDSTGGSDTSDDDDSDDTDDDNSGSGSSGSGKDSKEN